LHRRSIGPTFSEMAFALSSKATMGDSLALVAEAEIAALPRGDTPWTASDRAVPSLDERVHETRKTIKRLRALLRLFRSALPRSVYREEDARLRELAHALGGARDATALRESLELLVSRAGGAPLRDGLPALTGELRGTTAALSAETRTTLDSVQDALAAFSGRARGIQVEGADWTVLAPGFRDTYARGRRAFRRALERTTERRLHRLRSAVKRHQYQLTLLEPLWPELIRASRHEAQRLGELLGDDHDLSLLERRIRSLVERPGGLSLGPALLAEAARAHTELRRDALDLAARVYAEAPRHAAARFGRYFDAWR
jgi:CHAD domain-containing protein